MFIVNESTGTSVNTEYVHMFTTYAKKTYEKYMEWYNKYIYVIMSNGDKVMIKSLCNREEKEVDKSTQSVLNKIMDAYENGKSVIRI